MGSCLNFLAEPSVFFTAATLLVIVSLVWAQLYASGEVAKQVRSGRIYNVHEVMGLVWTYGAMFVALVAVATFPFGVDWAKGFLVLSFLMTVVNMLLALLRSFSLLWVPSEESLVGESSRKKRWVFFWGVLLLGLVFISFYVAGFVGHYFLWTGEGLVALVIVVVAKFIMCARCAARESKKNALK